MKARNFIPALIFFITLFIACDKKDDMTPNSVPVIA